MKVFVVDPGLDTGWVLWDPDDHGVTGLQYGHDDNPLRFAATAEALIDSRWLHTVVCERFIITPNTGKKSQAPWSLELIGVLRYHCAKAGVAFVEQLPTDAKTFADNVRLKRIGLYIPNDHARDAMRHLVLWRARSGDSTVL